MQSSTLSASERHRKLHSGANTQNDRSAIINVHRFNVNQPLFALFQLYVHFTVSFVDHFLCHTLYHTYLLNILQPISYTLIIWLLNFHCEQAVRTPWKGWQVEKHRSAGPGPLLEQRPLRSFLCPEGRRVGSHADLEKAWVLDTFQEAMYPQEMLS